MKKFFTLGTSVLLILMLAGCGDKGSEPPSVLRIYSDPHLDGDITRNLPAGLPGPPTLAINTGSVQAGIAVDAARTPISESRGFLVFPLRRLPANATIEHASISIFVNNVSFAARSTDPITFLLDSIDTNSYSPPPRSTDFDVAPRTFRSVSFFGTDAGRFVEINVTSLLAGAQRGGLPDFEVRFLFDEGRFATDPTTTRGLIEIVDSPTSISRAPLLRIEYF